MGWIGAWAGKFEVRVLDEFRARVGGAALCAKRKTIEIAFDFRSIAAPKVLTEPCFVSIVPGIVS
jgi:hypothetical protein